MWTLEQRSFSIGVQFGMVWAKSERPEAFVHSSIHRTDLDRILDMLTKKKRVYKVSWPSFDYADISVEAIS